MRRASARGFTLLEVMVAVAILGLALTAILSAQVGLFTTGTYGQHMSDSLSLARCRMSELEQQLLQFGFPDVDSNEEGPCCNDDPRGDMRCAWKIETINLPEPGAGDTVNASASSSNSFGPLPVPGGAGSPGVAGVPGLPGVPGVPGAYPTDTTYAGVSPTAPFGAGGALAAIPTVAPTVPTSTAALNAPATIDTSMIPGLAAGIPGLGGGAPPNLGALGALANAGASGPSGGGTGALSGMLAAGASAGTEGLAPMVMGLVYPSLKPMLESSIRKVTVTVRWREGIKDRNVEIIQWLTNPNKGGLLASPIGSDSAGLGGLLGGAAPGSTSTSTRTVPQVPR